MERERDGKSRGVSGEEGREGERPAPPDIVA